MKLSLIVVLLSGFSALAVVLPGPRRPHAAYPAATGPILDATAYGVVGDGATDASPGLDAMIAAIRARGNVPAGRPNPPTNAARIVLPPGVIVQSRPWILDCDYVEIQGRGPTLSKLAIVDYGPSLFVERSVPLRPGTRPDGFGILDTSMAPAPGNAWGFATRATGAALPGDFVVVSGYAPAVFPGGWQSLSALTIDVCLGSVPTGGAICGLGSVDNPSPWVLSYRAGDDGHVRFCLDFRTDAGGYMEWGDPPRTVRFGDVGTLAPGPHRVSVTVDLAHADSSGRCVARAWIDGREQPIARDYGTSLLGPSTREPSFVPSDSLHFRANKLATFKVGSKHWADHTFQEPSPSTRADLSIYGLLIASDTPYGSDAAGNQVRADGRPLSDSYRYRGIGRDAAAVVAKLGTWVPPSDRWVRFYGGAASGQTGGMGWIQYEHGDVGIPPVYGVAIRDVTIAQLPLGGDAVLLSGLVDFEASGVATSRGARGMAGLDVGANYHIKLRNCSFDGWDAWYVGVAQIVDCDGMIGGFIGGAALRFSGCDVRWGPLRAAAYNGPTGAAVEILDADSEYASEYAFEYINVDQEGEPAHPVIRCEKGTVQTGTYLRASDLSAGQRDARTPVVDLVDHYPGAATARAIVTNVKGAPPAVAKSGDWTVIVDGQVQR